MRLLVAAAAVIACCWAATAAAVSTHQVTKVKAIKQGGAVTGASVTMRFTSENNRSILVGLGYPNKNKNGQQYWSDPKMGYVIQELGSLTITPRSTIEHTFKFMLGQGNQLKIGDQFEVYSVWDSSHVFGSNRHESLTAEIFEVPGD